MATTYELISSNVLTGSAASVTFSSIPSTYTDLVLKWSARSDLAASNVAYPYIQINGTAGTAYSRTYLYGAGSGGTGSSRNSSTDRIYVSAVPAANATSNSFGNSELYLPSYLASQNKPLSSFDVVEYNSATVDENINLIAGLWSNTSAVTSISMALYSGNFVSGSSFYLYGIKNS